MEDSFWDSGYKLLELTGDEDIVRDLGPMLGLDVWAESSGDNNYFHGTLEFDKNGPYITNGGMRQRLSPGDILIPVNNNVTNNMRCKLKLIYKSEVL